MLNGRVLRAMPTGIAGLIFLATIVAVMWQADKGIGFGDEGIYLLAARYPDEIQQNVSAIFQFTGLLFSMAGHDVAWFRLLGVLANLLSAAWLWFGLYRLAEAFVLQERAVASLRYSGLLFVLISSLLHYQWSYLTPSYYTLTAIAVNLFAGCLFYGLAALETGRDRVALASCFATGLVFGFTLFFKFPTAFALLLMACSVLLCWRGPRLGLRVQSFLALAAGFGAWLVLYFAQAQGPARTIELFRQGWDLYQSLGYHNPADKLLAYPLNLWVVLRTSIDVFLGSFLILFASALVAWRLRRSGSRWASRASQAGIWLSILYAVAVSIPDGVMVDVPERLLTAPVDGVTRFYLVYPFAWLLLAGWRGETRLDHGLARAAALLRRDVQFPAAAGLSSGGADCWIAWNLQSALQRSFLLRSALVLRRRAAAGGESVHGRGSEKAGAGCRIGHVAIRVEPCHTRRHLSASPDQAAHAAAAGRKGRSW